MTLTISVLRNQDSPACDLTRKACEKDDISIMDLAIETVFPKSELDEGLHRIWLGDQIGKNARKYNHRVQLS